MTIANPQPFCPWSGFRPASIQFCEERLCGWIVEPANTWSNIGYLLVGLYVIHLSKKTGGSKTLGSIGWIAIGVFLGSTAFHATGTFLGELADLGAMFIFASYAFCFNLWRLEKYPTPLLLFLGTLMTSLGIAAMLYHNPVGISFFTGIIVMVAVTELLNKRKSTSSIDYRHLKWLCLFFAVSYAIWNLDIRHIVCNPQNHWLQGHSLWHLLNSTCFYFLYRFYLQFVPQNRDGKY
jgi:hypothetical protein